MLSTNSSRKTPSSVASRWHPLSGQRIRLSSNYSGIDVNGRLKKCSSDRSRSWHFREVARHPLISSVPTFREHVFVQCSAATLHRPVSLCTDKCRCAQTSVAVHRKVSLCTDQCRCARTSVAVHRQVSLCTYQCRCAQTSVAAHRPVSLRTDQCYCAQTSVTVQYQTFCQINDIKHRAMNKCAEMEVNLHAVLTSAVDKRE